MTDPQQPQDFQPAPAEAPAYQAAPPAAPAPAYQPAPAAQPGKVLGIVGLVLAFLMPLIGMILGIVAMVQSKKAGAKNGIALTAVILGAVFSVLWIIVGIIMTITFGMAAATLSENSDVIMQAAEACANGATEVEVLGQIIQCSDVL